MVGLVGGEIHKQFAYLYAERGQRLQYQILPMRVGFFNSGCSSIMGFYAPQPQPREYEKLDGLKYPKERVDGYWHIVMVPGAKMTKACLTPLTQKSSCVGGF